MSFSEVCIRRPVFSIVLTLVVVLLGVVTGLRLPLQQNPTINKPIVTVEVDLNGASPQVVESQITKLMEDQFARIDGLDYMFSSSGDGKSTVTMVFVPHRGINDVSSDIRDVLSRIRSEFPEGITEPIIKKKDANDKPVLFLTLTSDRMPVQEMYDYAQRYIQNELEVVSGTAGVEISGGGAYKMLIRLDPLKLAAYRLTPADVRSAVFHQSVETPGGRLVSRDREYMITTIATLDKAHQFDKVVVGNYKGQPIYLKDIGYAEISASDNREEVRFNSKPAVAIAIMKQSVANPLEVARGVKAILPKIQNRLPKGVDIHVAMDTTVFIEKSISEVYHTLFEAILLVVLVVYVFLWSLRASFIPLVAIPVSLIGALFLMYLTNCSLNTLTLLAMVLAIGLVVDDAIVILENIYIRIEKGMKPVRAAIEGTNEIAFAVIAMTLTLTAVYAPIGLATGETGKMFREFALALAGSVMLSGFVALTLSPMMCALILKPHTGEGNSLHLKVMEMMDNLYERGLKIVLKSRIIALALGICFSGLGYYLAVYQLPVEGAPSEDQGRVRVDCIPPQGTTLEYMKRYVGQLDEIMKKVPEVEKRLTQIVTPELTAFYVLQPWENRKRKAQEIAKELKKPLEAIAGLSLTPRGGGSAFSSGDSDVLSFAVLSPKSHEYLVEMAHSVVGRLHKYKGVENILIDAIPDVQDFAVEIDRERAAALGVDVNTIAETINILIGGKKSNTFIKEGKKYDVRIELEEELRSTPDVISSTYIRADKRFENNQEQMVPLSDVVKIVARAAPVEIRHYNKMRSVNVDARIVPGYNLWEAIEKVSDLERNLPNDIRIEFTNETRTFINESQSIYMIFGLALTFIFLVLAAQFESFIDPFIIMMSVPVSLAGALVTLAIISGGSLNTFSQIGLVTLIGLITKHGILIVEFSNQLREKGGEMFESVLTASKMRLRPILMTTFAMVLGAIPLALASGAGAESRRQIGWVVVGGMSIGTMFTLFIVPVVYTYLSRKEFNKEED